MLCIRYVCILVAWVINGVQSLLYGLLFGCGGVGWVMRFKGLYSCFVCDEVDFIRFLITTLNLFYLLIF